MPTIKVNDIDMYYEIHGTGEPLVLIAGLNSDHALYRSFLSRLAAHNQIIVFDNRGVGQSSKPDIPYSIEMMADDTAGLLDELGITEAHILGTSMGGRIAVALALRHPHHVKSLILVSTVMTMKGVPRRRLMPLILRIPVIRGSHPYYVVVRQMAASRAFDYMDRLGEIRVPTLILHGKSDKSVPYPLVEAMHYGIKDSERITFNGGHLFFLVRSQQFMTAIENFLNSPELHGDIE